MTGAASAFPVSRTAWVSILGGHDVVVESMKVCAPWASRGADSFWLRRWSCSCGVAADWTNAVGGVDGDAARHLRIALGDVPLHGHAVLACQPHARHPRERDDDPFVRLARWTGIVGPVVDEELSP